MEQDSQIPKDWVGQNLERFQGKIIVEERVDSLSYIEMSLSGKKLPVLNINDRDNEAGTNEIIKSTVEVALSEFGL